MGWWSNIRDQIVKPVARVLVPQYAVAEKIYNAARTAKKTGRPGQFIEDVGKTFNNPVTEGLGRTVDNLQTAFEEPIRNLANAQYAEDRARASEIAKAQRQQASPKDLPTNAVIDHTGKLLVADKVINVRSKDKRPNNKVIKGSQSRKMANKGSRRGSFKKGLGL